MNPLRNRCEGLVRPWGLENLPKGDRGSVHERFTGMVFQQGECLEKGFFLLFHLRGIRNNVHSGVAPFPETVDSAESLDQGVQCRQIGDHMVGVEVHADLAGGGRDQVVGAFQRYLFQEGSHAWFLHKKVPFVSSDFACEDRNRLLALPQEGILLRLFHGLTGVLVAPALLCLDCKFLHESLLNIDRIFRRLDEDYDSALLQGVFPGQLQDLFQLVFLIFRLMEPEFFHRKESLHDGLVLVVIGFEGDRRPDSSLLGEGRSEGLFRLMACRGELQNPKGRKTRVGFSGVLNLLYLTEQKAEGRR